MAEFSFGFTEGSFLQLNCQKHFRSVAADLISNKQKRTKRIYQKQRMHGHYKSLKPIFLNRIITLSACYFACENKYHVMRRHPYSCHSVSCESCKILSVGRKVVFALRRISSLRRNHSQRVKADFLSWQKHSHTRCEYS